MASRALRVALRSRAALTGLAAMLGLALGGCSATGAGQTSSAGVTARGRTLDIVAAAPLHPVDPQGAQDVLDAEQLAFRQLGSIQPGGFHMRFIRVARPEISDDARAAIEDQSSIAYIGELDPGASADSVGITNALDLLQVSPTDTFAPLTQSDPAVPGAPTRYYESLSAYGRTFARVAPTTRREAAALVPAIAALGVHRLYVATDGTPYGAALAAAIAQAPGSGLQVKRGSASASAVGGFGADGLLLASRSPALARAFIPQAAQSSHGLRVFLPSALYSGSLAAQLGGQVSQLYADTPGILPRSLPASARTFVRQFSAAYGHAPDPRAIFGYEAVSAVLDTLSKAAGNANNRATVVHDFFAIRNRPPCTGAASSACSLLGSYSIDSSGDTSLAPLILSRLRGGSLVPLRQLTAAG